MRSRFSWVLALCLVLWIAAPPAAAAQDQPASRPTVNLNSATLDQLETLPGIGRKTAELIVEYRTKNSGFKKVEELMNIKGIGEKTFLKIKPMVSVTPAGKASGGH